MVPVSTRVYVCLFVCVYAVKIEQQRGIEGISQRAFFSWTKRLLRPAFSDDAHFSFLTFLLYRRVHGVHAATAAHAQRNYPLRFVHGKVRKDQ